MPLDDRPRLRHLHRLLLRRRRGGRRRRRRAKHHHKSERDRVRVQFRLQSTRRNRKTRNEMYSDKCAAHVGITREWKTRLDYFFNSQNCHSRKLIFAHFWFYEWIKKKSLSLLLLYVPLYVDSCLHFSLPRHRHSPCLNTFSRISGHFVIAPPPSPSTSFSVLPRPLLLLLLRPRLLLLPPPPPFLPFPPPASPPSTSGDDSCCRPLSSSSSFLRFFLWSRTIKQPPMQPITTWSRCGAASGGAVVRVD